jgi:hypothetical protein
VAIALDAAGRTAAGLHRVAQIATGTWPRCLFARCPPHA